MAHTANPRDPADLLHFGTDQPPSRRYALWGVMAAVAVVALLVGLAFRHLDSPPPAAGTAEPGAAPIVDRGFTIEAEIHALSDAVVVRNLSTADWPAGQVEVEARGNVYRASFPALAAGSDLRVGFVELRTTAGEGFAAAGATPEKITVRTGGGVLSKDLVPPPTSAPEVPGAATAPAPTAPTVPPGASPSVQ